jgi:hypothetical protein
VVKADPGIPDGIPDGLREAGDANAVTMQQEEVEVAAERWLLPAVAAYRHQGDVAGVADEVHEPCVGGLGQVAP